MAASHHTSPPEDAVVSRLRSLPAEEKNRRLIQAAEKGTVGELEALLAAGADVAATDECFWRRTALHWAAWEGHMEVARRLMARGAPLDATDFVQQTPLHVAAVNGRAAMVRLLLAASADHSARECGGLTPLHCAAVNGHAEAAVALLEAGADRAARSGGGATPLHLARVMKQQHMVELLRRT